MKGISTKKVFKVIGIVLASALGFVGAVIGVMAAMGKFKTPTVYPTVLEFAVTEQTIIETKTFNPKLKNPDGSIAWESQFQDAKKAPEIYSFELKGTNPDSEHEVNKTSCYLWFENITGKDLITLCKKTGEPLTADENNRYHVNCNEPIYYMVNEIDKNAQVGSTDGKVVLRAGSTNETLQRPENPLTIWIDREVKSIFVKDSKWTNEYYNTTISTINGVDVQSISIGVDASFDFSYVVNTPLSINPIAKESAKEIELYYLVNGYDHVRITKETYDASPEIEDLKAGEFSLKQFLTYDEETKQFSFSSTEAKAYTFLIAVFPSYQSKTDYLQSIEGKELAHPNFDRTNNMKCTTFNITVDNTEITEVGFESSGVALNLYSKYDYVTLNGVSGVENAKENNLELYMTRGEGINDTSRFDEINFLKRADYNEEVLVGITRKTPTIKINDEEFKFEEYDTLTDKYAFTSIVDNEEVNLTVVGSKIKVAENLEIISSVTDGANDYYFINGVPVLDTSAGKTIRLLNSGSYMSFFVKNADNYTVVNNEFDYEVQQPINSEKTKSWNIISKSLANLGADKKIVLGLLVANSTGEFKVANFFKTVDVSITEVELDYEILQSSINYDINFIEGGIQSNSENFEDIINIKNGSYNACVFIVKEKKDGVNNINMVNVIPEINYTVDGSKYLLVGNIDADGFVNEVNVNGNVNKDNKDCEIYMLTLKNAYGKTAKSIIDAWLTSGHEIETGEVNSFNNTAGSGIAINAKYILDTSSEALSVKHYNSLDPLEETPKDENNNNLPYVYEKSNNSNKSYYIVLHPLKNNDMLTKIFDYYGLDNAGRLSVNYSSTLDGVSIYKHDNLKDLVVEFKTKEALVNDQTPIVITLKDGEKDLLTFEFLIKDGNPDAIIYVKDNDGSGTIKENEKFALSQNIDDAKTSNYYIKAVSSYSSGYVSLCSIWAKGGNNDNKVFDSVVFNASTTDGTLEGFKGDKDKEQTLNVEYYSLDESVFTVDINGTNFTIKKVEVAYLKVKVGTTEYYLRVETIADNYASEVIETSFTAKEVKISSIIGLKYSGTDISPLSKANLVDITSVSKVYYGGGSVEVKEKTYNPGVVGSYDGYVLQTKTSPAVDVLTIKNDDSNGWTFTRINPYVKLKLTIEVQTVLKDAINITLDFTSTITVDITEAWQEKQEFYADTSVKLYGTDYSVFNVSVAVGATLPTISFKILKKDGTQIATAEDSNSYKYSIGSSDIGNIKIEVTVGQETLPHYPFEVKPNVIATIKTESLKSGKDDYTVGDVYGLQKYTNQVYGSDGSKLYFSKTYYTNDTYQNETADITAYYKFNKTNTGCLAGLSNLSDLSIKPLESGSQNQNPEITWDTSDNKLKIGDMTILGQVQRKVKLLYNGVPITDEEDVITIKHKYIVDGKFTTEPIGEYKALKAYTPIASLTSDTGYTLKSVADVNGEYTFKIIGNKVVLMDVLTDKEGIKCNVEFTFEHLSDPANNPELKYMAEKLLFIPFTPDEIDPPINEITAMKDYDFLTGKYELNNIMVQYEDDILENNGYIIKSISVADILDENDEAIAQEVVKEFGLGKTYSITDDASSFTFEKAINDIVGSYKDVKIKYTLTFYNGTTYDYTLPLKIKNRQAVTLNYPDKAKVTSLDAFIFLDGREEDIKALEANEKTVQGSKVYTFDNNEYIYESVLIKPNQITTIDLTEEDYKKTVRVEVKENATIIKEDLTITLIAYEADGAIVDFVNGLENKVFTNQIVLNCDLEPGFGGKLIFRIETPSGAYNHYFVHVYNSDNKNTDGNNNVNIVLGSGDALSNDLYINGLDADVYDYKKYSDNKYHDLAKDYVIFEKFGIKYDIKTTKLFLYKGVNTGADFGYGNPSIRWTEISETEKISQTKYFQTLTVGLVYCRDNQQYCFGTLTIYVQPTTEVKATNTNQFVIDSKQTFNYELPNGEFTASVEPSATQITNPFGLGWKAEIVSVNGVVYDNNNTTPYDRDESNGNIGIKQRFPEDQTLKVKYSHTTSGTITYVTYTYLATVIPEEDIQANTVIVGRFENETSGFAKTVNISTSKFMGTYAGDITLNVGGSELTNGATIGNVKRTGNTLTFTQTTQEQPIDITIKYNSYDGEPTRTFRFVVKPGVHLDETSTASDSGLTIGKRKVTTATGNFEGSIGSTLDVAYSTGTGYHKFEVGGLKIYTADLSFLELTFASNTLTPLELKDGRTKDNGKLTNDANANIKVSESTVSLDLKTNKKIDSINFAHVASENQNVTVSISVKNSSKVELAKRDFYISVIPTYKTLNAVYCAEGADHENVVNNTNKSNLHGELFNGVRLKLELLETPAALPNIDLTKMGFTIEGNPNRINFEAGDFGTIREYGTAPNITKGILFHAVSSNQICEVSLSNHAGLSGVIYKYQVMAGTKVDGLDDSTSNGYVDDGGSYSTFIMAPFYDVAEKKYSYSNNRIEGLTNVNQPFVIGSMLDENNETVFKVTDFTIGGSNLISNQEDYHKTAIVEGKYKTGKTGFANEGGTAIGLYDNAIQYIFKNNGFAYYLTYDIDKYTHKDSNETNRYKNIELIVIYEANAVAPASQAITLSITGVNAENGYILNKYELYLSTDKVETSYSEGKRDIVYGGYTRNLIDDEIFVDNGANLTYDLAQSSYYVNGQTKNISAGDKTNALFILSGNDIEFRAVASTIEANIVFIVKNGDYVIKDITYYVQVNINFQLIVNGEAIKDSAGKKLETHFILTPEADDDANSGFPIQINFKGKDDVKPTNVQTSGSNKYYNILALDLYRKYDQDEANPTDEDLHITRGSNVKIVPQDNEWYQITSAGITFKKELIKDPIKEYTIVVDLQIVIAGLGTYRTDWEIYVTPILAIESVAVDENSSITYMPSHFDSGSTVNLIQKSGEDGFGVGINIAESQTGFVGNGKGIRDYIEVPVAVGENVYGYYTYNAVSGNYTQETNKTATAVSGTIYYSYGVRVNYEYKILPYHLRETSTNQKLFENLIDNIGSGSGDGELNLDTLAYSVMLPNVPSSLKRTPYLVTYKVYLTYLGLNANTAQTIYLTYVVANEQKVTTYVYEGTQSASVNVTTDIENNNLDLFYYSDIYTVGTDTYKFIYSNEIKLVLGVTTYAYNSAKDNGNKRYFGSDVAGYVYDVSAKTLSQISAGTETLISGGKWSKETAYKNNAMLVVTYVDVESNKYVFTHTGSDVTMTINGESAGRENSLDGVNILGFTKDGKEYKYDTTANARKLFVNDSQLYGGTWSAGQGHSVFNSDFKNIFEFKNFVDTYLNKESVKLTDVETNDEFKFNLIEIGGSGRYGIKLNVHGTLFNNHMYAKFVLLDGETETVTIEAYSETANNAGFRLYANTTITAKKSVKLTNMFIKSYFGNYYSTLSKISVVGIGISPSTDWVTGASDCTYGDSIGMIKVPNGAEGGEGTTNYEIKPVTYKNDSVAVGSFYTISTVMYYINADKVVVPNYVGVGLSESSYSIAYTGNDSVELDLTKAFKVYTSDPTIMAEEPTTIGGDPLSAFAFEAGELKDKAGNDLPTPTLNTNKVSIAKSALDNYKLENPNKTIYPTILMTVQVDGVTIQTAIEYSLAEYPIITAEISSVDDEFELIGKIYIPKSETKYEILTTSNLGNIKEIVEVDSYGHLAEYNKNTSKLKFAEGVKDGDTFDCELTTTSGYTMRFTVVVKITPAGS